MTLKMTNPNIYLPFVEFIEEGETYNIVKAGDRYISIAKSLGPLNLFDERIGEREIKPYILFADTLLDLKEKIRKNNKFWRKIFIGLQEYK